MLLFQTDVVPLLKEMAKTVLNGVLQLLLFQTDVVPPLKEDSAERSLICCYSRLMLSPPLKETAKTVLNVVLFVAIPD